MYFYLTLQINLLIFVYFLQIPTNQIIFVYYYKSLKKFHIFLVNSYTLILCLEMSNR